jgi:mannose-6-phosphate isomerase-like protein (cupin superfamily)
MDEGSRFKVKRICVKPGAQLSLQKHWHRSEHWVIVTGCAVVSRDGQDMVLRENESTFIPAGTVHRLTNPGHVELHMIEVQSGEYVGEDDIVRLADDYGRTEPAVERPSRPALSQDKPAVKRAPKSKRKPPPAKPHRKSRRKANPAAASRRRAVRHPVRPPTKIAGKAAIRRKPAGKPKPPGKPPRRR